MNSKFRTSITNYSCNNLKTHTQILTHRKIARVGFSLLVQAPPGGAKGLQNCKIAILPRVTLAGNQLETGSYALQAGSYD